MRGNLLGPQHPDPKEILDPGEKALLVVGRIRPDRGQTRNVSDHLPEQPFRTQWVKPLGRFDQDRHRPPHAVHQQVPLASPDFFLPNRSPFQNRAPDPF